MSGRKPHQRPQKSKGQISILIVLTLIPVFTLFAFVVNIGMLVNAKISLQNAADLAAYAGAATQARQLTHLSHINYMMRQSYKKFLFRYYVLGNMSMRCFPRKGGGASEQNCVQYGGRILNDDQKFNWLNPDGSGQGTLPGVPSVCISLAPESNPCQLGKAVPLVKVPECFPLDPICGALKSSTETIAEIQKQSCAANSLVNQELLTLWLYSTDDQMKLTTQASLQGLVNDIGLVTETTMLYERAKTVSEKYINSAPRTRVTEDQMTVLSQAPDQAVTERTILAYRTAASNLNERVFSRDTVEMTELMPSQMLAIKPIEVPFTAYYTEMQGESSKCDLAKGELTAKPILGIYKEPASQNNYDVFYAIQLKAKAKLLFNPFPTGSPDGSIELTAYSAAAPFGSRIGPALTPNQFVAKPTVANAKDYPTLLLTPEGQEQKTWETVGLLRSLYRKLQGDDGGTARMTNEDINRALRAALLPDEFEVGKYNVPVDTESFFMSYFEKQPDGFPGLYTFWAPMISPGSGSPSDILNNIKGAIENSISATRTQDTSKDRVANLLIEKLGSYFARLRSQRGYNVAVMQDPLAHKKVDMRGGNPGVSFKQADPTTLATSFSSDYLYESTTRGREGYSVKFIPFRKVSGRIALAQDDISQIQH